jgi:hypothetical protein
MIGIDLSLGAILLILWSATIYVIKIIVSNTIESKFDTYSKRFEKRLDFEQKILGDRYTLIMDLSRRLENIMTNINRMRKGMEIPEGFLNKDNELIPLTEIFEDIDINRLALTEQFYELFTIKAQLALKAASIKDQQDWTTLAVEWGRNSAEIRSVTDEVFSLSKIRMQI